MASYSFLTASELVSKSRDGASFKKSTRKSRAMKCNKLLTNMASKFVKKKFWNSCASLFQFQNIYRMNSRRCSSEKTTTFAMVVTRITRMGQNNTVFYLTYLQSLVLFVEEIQKRILSQNMSPNISKNSF